VRLAYVHGYRFEAIPAASRAPLPALRAIYAEPAATARLGFGPVRAEAELGYSSRLFGDRQERYSWRPVTLALGVSLQLDHFDP
jgi:hypothetical protein